MLKADGVDLVLRAFSSVTLLHRPCLHLGLSATALLLPPHSGPSRIHRNQTLKDLREELKCSCWMFESDRKAKPLEEMEIVKK